MSESSKLIVLVNKAIEDGIVTNKEYHDILAQAAADGREDLEEKAILANFHEMIANGTVKRAP